VEIMEHKMCFDFFCKFHLKKKIFILGRN